MTLHYQAFILLILATSCGKNISKESPTKQGNHFIESLLAKRMGVDQQLFTIDTKKDTIINLRKGGRINISDSSFCDQATQIHIAVKEIYSLADIILENMHSESSEGILSSGGMFKIECQEQNIQINPKYPIIIEIPTFTIVEGMKCYKANFEENYFSWEDPKALHSFLTTVPLDSLSFDFLMINNNSAPLNITDREEQNTMNYEKDQESDSTSFSSCGISSELVSLLNLASFSNSLIATKEFENRMQYIHRSCDTTVFWLYVKNLDLNLFEIDKLAYDYLQFINNPYAGSFLAFFEQRLTKVKKAITPIAEIINFKNKLNQEAYRYKMSAFDFGWYNIDKILKDPRIDDVNLILKLKNEQKFDEIQLTLLIPSKKVSLQLLSKDENTYFVNKKDLKLPIGEQAELIFIGLQDSQTYFYKQHLAIKNDMNIEVVPRKTPPHEIIESLDTLFPAKENMIYRQVQFCCESIGG